MEKELTAEEIYLSQIWCVFNEDQECMLSGNQEEDIKNILKKYAEMKNQDEPKLTICDANRDGECFHPLCPQIRDNEPEKAVRT